MNCPHCDGEMEFFETKTIETEAHEHFIRFQWIHYPCRTLVLRAFLITPERTPHNIYVEARESGWLPDMEHPKKTTDPSDAETDDFIQQTSDRLKKRGT